MLALFLGGASDDSTDPSPTASSPSVLPPVTVAAPPASSAVQRPCIQVVQALPPTLAGLAPRIVHSTPGSPFVVGWGEPAIVLRCGVARPASLKPGDSELLTGVNGVFFSKRKSGDSNVFTVIDRSAYIEISVPSEYGGGPLAPLATAIGRALPALCQATTTQGGKAVAENQLCTHRR